VYSSATNQVKKTVSRFKEAAYSGCFRHDGRLLAAGSEEGVVKVEEYHVDVATHPHNTCIFICMYCTSVTSLVPRPPSPGLRESMRLIYH